MWTWNTAGYQIDLYFILKETCMPGKCSIVSKLILNSCLYYFIEPEAGEEGVWGQHLRLVYRWLLKQTWWQRTSSFCHRWSWHCQHSRGHQWARPHTKKYRRAICTLLSVHASYQQSCEPRMGDIAAFSNGLPPEFRSSNPSLRSFTPPPSQSQPHFSQQSLEGTQSFSQWVSLKFMPFHYGNVCNMHLLPFGRDK